MATVTGRDGPIELPGYSELSDQLRAIEINHPELQSYYLDAIKDGLDQTVYGVSVYGLITNVDTVPALFNDLYDHLEREGINYRTEFPELKMVEDGFKSIAATYRTLGSDNFASASTALIENYEYFNPMMEERFGLIHQDLTQGQDIAKAFESFRARFPLVVNDGMVAVGDVPPEQLTEMLNTALFTRYRPLDLGGTNVDAALQAISPDVYARYLETDKDLTNPATQHVLATAFYDDYRAQVDAMDADISINDTVITIPDPYNPPHYIMVSPDDNLDEAVFIGSRVADFQGWHRTKLTIEAAGGEVTVIDGANAEGNDVERWPRDTFVPIVREGETILINTGLEHHADNREQVLRAAQDSGENIRVIDSPVNLEGGDTLYDPVHNVLFISQSTLTYDDEAARDTALALKETTLQRSLEEAGLDTRVVALYTDDDASHKFYHTDVFMNILPGGEAIVYPDALRPGEMDKLRGIYGADNIIEMAYSEARNMPANFVAVGNTIIMPEIPATDQVDFLDDLRARGYEVTMVEGGSQDPLVNRRPAGIHCSVLDVSMNPLTPERAEAPELTGTRPALLPTPGPSFSL